MSQPNHYQPPIQVVHNAYTPKEAIEISSRAGAYKANMRIDKIIMSSFMAGALLSFAGACYVTINTSPWYQENAPGVIKMYGALVFPFGLVVIVMTGADLATGSFMVGLPLGIPCLVSRTEKTPRDSILLSRHYIAEPRRGRCFSTGF